MTGRRVVVADDDALLREGIASLLTAAGHDVVAQADDAATLRQAVRTTIPEARDRRHPDAAHPDLGRAGRRA